MRLFHVSANNLHGKMLKPSIPDNILTKLGIEDSKTPRISFAPDVNSALLGVGFNRLKSGPKVLNVFEPENDRLLKIKTSNELYKKGLVPDADKTKEHWVLNNVKVKYAGKIRLLNPTNKFVEVKIGPGRGMRNYYWNYKVLDGDIK